MKIKVLALKSIKFTRFILVDPVWYVGSCLSLPLSSWVLPYCELLSHREVVHIWIYRKTTKRKSTNKSHIKICVYSPPKLNDRRTLFGIFDTNTAYKRLKALRLFSDILSLCGCPDKWNARECGENAVDGRLMNILMKKAVQELLLPARASETPNFWLPYPYSFTLSKTWTEIVVTLSVNPTLSVFICKIFFVIKFLLVMTQLWKLHSWTFYDYITDEFVQINKTIAFIYHLKHHLLHLNSISTSTCIKVSKRFWPITKGTIFRTSHEADKSLRPTKRYLLGLIQIPKNAVKCSVNSENPQQINYRTSKQLFRVIPFSIYFVSKIESVKNFPIFCCCCFAQCNGLNYDVKQ